MRHIDRHALAMLIEYEKLTSATPEIRAARSSDVENWLKIVHDRATEQGRKTFVDLVNSSGGEWPWSGVTPIQVDLAGLDDDLAAAIDRAPPALLLLVLQDTSEPELLDPDNWIGDGEEWIPLRDALLSWSPETIETFMNKGIWSPPVSVDASPSQSGAEPGADSGSADIPPAGGQEPAQEPSGTPTPPARAPTQATPSIWKSWQLWTSVGVAVVATYGVMRVRRG